MSRFFRQSISLYLIAISGFILSLLAFWPGFMEYDSFEQYGQAIGKLNLNDWHPISMTLLWRALLGIYNGPQPMLVLQLFLYWTGFLYLAKYLFNQTARLSIALSAVIIPFAPFLINFSGVIWKDTHLAISLFWAALLLGLGKSSRHKLILSLIFIFYAISVRHNGIAAALPIIVLWSYQFIHLIGIQKKYFIQLTTVSIALIYFLINLGLSSLITFKRTNPLNVQLLNEIAFIQCQISLENLTIPTQYYGSNLLKINPHDQKKYLCNHIISLAKTDDTNAIYDQKILKSPDGQDLNLKYLWLHNVIAHPLSYLYYRLTVYLTFLRPLNYRDPYYISLGGMDENPLPFPLPFKVFNPFNLTTIFNDYLDFTSRYLDLLFRPFFWLTTLLLTTGFLLYQKRNIDCLVTLSGLLYLIFYFLVLPAPDFRYAYYSIFAQILAIYIFISR